MEATGPAQRWLGRRQSFNADARFDPGIHGVEALPDAAAKAFIKTHHYSASYPAAILAVGLMRMEDGRAALAGAAVFSVPIQPKAAASYGAVGATFCDLGRFCLLDHVEANAETWFLRRALAMLAAAKTGPDGRPAHRLVMAYADPVPRVDRHGTTTMPGHVGHIYGAAGSATYLGRATARTLVLDADGRVVSERTLSKLRTGERGAEAAYRTLLAKGAPTRERHEDAADYVRRALSEGPFRRIRHPGNHAYAFPCGSHAQKRRTAASLRSVAQRPRAADPVPDTAPRAPRPAPAREIGRGFQPF